MPGSPPDPVHVPELSRSGVFGLTMTGRLFGKPYANGLVSGVRVELNMNRFSTPSSESIIHKLCKFKTMKYKMLSFYLILSLSEVTGWFSMKGSFLNSPLIKYVIVYVYKLGLINLLLYIKLIRVKTTSFKEEKNYKPFD